MKQFDRVVCIIFIGLALVLWAAAAQCQDLPTPPQASKEDQSDKTLGTVFQARSKVIVLGIRYFRDANFTGTTVGHFWGPGGQLIESGTFPPGSGWIYLPLKQPVTIEPGQDYVVSYSNDGGYYTWQEFFWPKKYALWEATNGVHAYWRNTYPTEWWNFACYFVEPVLTPWVDQAPTAPGTRVDTVYQYVAVGPFGREDWSYYIDRGLTLALQLPEQGGQFLMPDSTTLYQAMYGAAPPHVTQKETLPRVHRFTHSFQVNNQTVKYRFTLYRTGAWIREQYINGAWTVIPYAPY